MFYISVYAHTLRGIDLLVTPEPYMGLLRSNLFPWFHLRRSGLSAGGWSLMQANSSTMSQLILFHQASKNWPFPWIFQSTIKLCSQTLTQSTGSTSTTASLAIRLAISPLRDSSDVFCMSSTWALQCAPASGDPALYVRNIRKFVSLSSPALKFLSHTSQTKPPPNMAFALARNVALKLSMEAKSCSSSDRSLSGIAIDDDSEIPS